jgi:1-deoxy-D-xylulose-5-phosphate synthase
VVAIGVMAARALEAAESLAGSGPDLTVVNARFAKPVDRELLVEFGREHPRLATVEENVLAGGFGDAVGDVLADAGLPAPLRIGLPSAFIDQAPRNRLLDQAGLSTARLSERFRAHFG